MHSRNAWSATRGVVPIDTRSRRTDATVNKFARSLSGNRESNPTSADSLSSIAPILSARMSLERRDSARKKVAAFDATRASKITNDSSAQSGTRHPVTA
jgi:hypothetical protein